MTSVDCFKTGKHVVVLYCELVEFTWRSWGSTVSLGRLLLHKQSSVSIAASLTYITFLVLRRQCMWLLSCRPSQVVTFGCCWIGFAVVPHTAVCKVTACVVMPGNVCHSCTWRDWGVKLRLCSSLFLPGKISFYEIWDCNSPYWVKLCWVLLAWVLQMT